MTGRGAVVPVGLIPAAGSAHRIAPLPCSKEVLPVGFRRDERGDIRVEVASHHLLQKFRRAGAATAYVILRPGKWDIPAYWGDGQSIGVRLAYLVIADSIGPPDTLDRAHAFVADQIVVFGFPDILFGPDDVYEQLLARLRHVEADLVLGLYRAHDVSQMDMVRVDDDGWVRSIELKPHATELHFAWLCAAWSPAFTQFMRVRVEHERRSRPAGASPYQHIDAQGDFPMGAVIKAAVEHGLRVYGVEFPDDTYIDIGTPAHLLDVSRRTGANGAKS